MPRGDGFGPASIVARRPALHRDEGTLRRELGADAQRDDQGRQRGRTEDRGENRERSGREEAEAVKDGHEATELAAVHVRRDPVDGGLRACPCADRATRPAGRQSSARLLSSRER